MNRVRGFTLIEVLISIALVALLGLSSALALNTAIRSNDIVNTRMSRLEQLQSAQHLIRSDLEQILPRLGRDQLGDARSASFEASPTADPAREGQLLAFYRGGRRLLGSRFPGTTIERVRYRLAGTALMRESSPVLDPSGDAQWRSWALLQKVEGLQLKFFYEDRWIDHWPPLDLDHPPVLPKAVQLTLSLPDYGNLTQRILLPENP